MELRSHAIVAILAGVLATHATVTISWNTHAPASPAPATAIVSSVQGTRVVLRLQNGTLRAYTATPAQARVLHALVGTAIHYRLYPR
jgi:hypothetical protein